MSTVFPVFPDRRYQIIYADPPWQYRTKECLATGSVLDGKHNKHYPTMTVDELKQLPVQNITDQDALLFLWVVSPMLDDCIDTLKAWGFKYGTVAFVWYKRRSNPGHYTLSECELCLVGRHGRIPQPRGQRNIRQFMSELRSNTHSRKPDEVRKRITAMFPQQAKIELFARGDACSGCPGWDVWGNEV